MNTSIQAQKILNLRVKREIFTENSTIGTLSYAENQKFNFLCYTLEDKCRQKFGEPWNPACKIPKETAIPYGRYRLVVNYSPKFKKNMPRLLNVPSFDGILLHLGNTALDSSGCIILGMIKQKDTVLHSKIAFEQILMPLLHKYLMDGYEIWIEIVA